MQTALIFYLVELTGLETNWTRTSDLFDVNEAL